jgi:anti-sigma B factor antagonist
MELSKSSINGWQAIHVVGQVDSKTVGELREYIDKELEEGKPVALDVQGVPFMSSAGLRTLLTLHRRTEEMAVSLALVGITSEIADTMKVTGFYDYFTKYANISSLPEA